MATATSNTKETAEQMIESLASDASRELARDGLTRQDRFGYEADLKLVDCHKAIVASGWAVEHSTHGSVYYTREGSDFVHNGKPQRMRLSNHEVPSTAERDAAGFTWARHGYQIITQGKSLQGLLQDIADFNEDFE